MARTVGHARLDDALRTRRVMTQADLARALHVTPQAVADWLRGDSAPRAELMAKIEDLLGIPMRAWTESSEPSDEKPTGTSGV